MKYIHSLANRQMTAIAIIIIIIVASFAIAPWHAAAQNSKSGSPEAARNHWSLEWTEETIPKCAVAVQVDDEGHYNDAGRVMKLNEIATELKNAATINPKALLVIQVTPNAPVRRLVELLDKLDDAGIRRVSLVSLTQCEASRHIVPVLPTPIHNRQ